MRVDTESFRSLSQRHMARLKLGRRAQSGRGSFVYRAPGPSAAGASLGPPHNQADPTAAHTAARSAPLSAIVPTRGL